MSREPKQPSTVQQSPSAPADPWWKSIEEYNQDALDDCVQDEFPSPLQGGELLWSRRDFMKLMGASMALAGVSGCSGPADEEIAPYVHAPLQGVEGEARHYASAVTLNGFASGVVATSYMGRPVKLEGNPRHPASDGGTDIFTQAAILQLWDPDRSALVLRKGASASWDDLAAALHDRLAKLRAAGGAGLRVLTGNVTSPSLLAQLRALMQAFPQARWHQYEPICDDHVSRGAQIAFGEPLQSGLKLEKAGCVISLDADILGPGPDQTRLARQFAKSRREAQQGGNMLRLYAVESYPTLTGALADHRKAVRARDVEGLARAIASRLGAPLKAPDRVAVDAQWLDAVVQDLQDHGKAGLVVAGRRQPPQVHALAHWINEHIGASGETVVYHKPVVPPVQQMDSLRELVESMRGGGVDTLLIIDGNPAYGAPADLQFAAALKRVPMSVHLGLYADETAQHCTWHVPAAHELESWGDARDRDGTASIQQPLVAPLYGGHTPQELFAVAMGNVGAGDHDLVREYWRVQWGDGFDSEWKQALRTGLVKDSAMPAVAAQVRGSMFADLPAEAPPNDSLEIGFAPDSTIWDGRYANNAWLQELPKPMTQLTWDNAVQLSPTTAKELGIENEQVLILRYSGNELRVPAWISPGHADGAVTLTLGYGRQSGGQVAAGAGVNANNMRRSTAPWFDHGLELRVTDDRYPLATTQVHHRLHDRHMIREASLDQYRRNPKFAKRSESGPKPSLYPPYAYEGHAWGMVVNLNSCIGCGACTIACQAENNIPVVGKQQVRMSREMHWIRVDRYFKGSIEEPETYFQPVPCMQCEHASCEVVCPVGATMHDSEGLNVQVYNRCIGTRFCSNNCPYKVRRFNFLQYADRDTPSLKAQRNPEVTVRMRGVMEKCTYCVQRIERARIAAQREDRPFRGDEVKTACQQVCPAAAITFGDINDPESEVQKEKQSPLDYTMLEELNTRPRTSYTAKLRNPNPALRKRS